MWGKHRWILFRKPWRFHHIGAHPCSSKGAKPPRNPMVISGYYFYFVICLETQWFAFHGPQLLWNNDWVAFIPKACQNQDIQKIFMVTCEGQWLLLPVVVMSINLFLFLAWTLFWLQTMQGTAKTQIKDILKASLSLPLPFFISCIFPPDFPYLHQLHVFTTAWDHSSWNVRTSWFLNIINLNWACSYLSHNILWMS